MATTTTTTTTTGTATVGGGTTVDNLNVLDTSKTNDTNAEIITLLEVANALFPTTNATQTLTIDSSFWSDNLRLTFSIGNSYYTIWGATSPTNSHSIQIAQTDALGNYTSALTATLPGTLAIDPTATAATDITQFLSWISQQTGVQTATASLLVTADIDGGAGKDNIQG